MFHGLALGLESAGMIKRGSVQKHISPLGALREKANDEIIELNNAVRDAADGVYGSPYYYPDPDTSLETVAKAKQMEVLPQEPDMIYIMKLHQSVYGTTIRGEAVNHADRSPIRSLEGSNHLVVLDRSKNEQLTSHLLEERSFLRYLLGSRIVALQRKKMSDMKHTFHVVRERKQVDTTPGKKWPFEVPARKPVTP